MDSEALGECEKTVLQTGAVIGKEFPESILRRVVDLEDADLAAALRALVEGSPVTRRRCSGFRWLQ